MKQKLICCIILAILSQPLFGRDLTSFRNNDGSSSVTASARDGQAPSRAVGTSTERTIAAPQLVPHSALTLEQNATSTDYYLDPGVGDYSGSLGCPPPLFYGTVEAVFLNRANDSFAQPLVVDVNSDETLLSTSNLDFDYEPGVRATIGLRRPACCFCSAWEFTYLGVFDSDASSSVVGDNDLAVPGDLGFVVNGFTLAESIRAEYGSKLHSAEANCVKCFYEHCCCHCYRRVDWFAGIRYLSLDEDVTLRGNNQNVAAAIYNLDTDNNLYGAQIGSRVRTYRGCWGWELQSKAGIFANDASQRQYIVDEFGVNDFLLRSASASGEGVAFVGELNLSLLLRISAACGLRCGYNLLWVEGIALAPDQLDFSDTAGSGTVLHSGGGSFFHGANVGLEIGW